MSYSKKIFMLQLREILRPLLLWEPPNVGWEKWSLICSNSKQSQDIKAGGGGGGDGWGRQQRDINSGKRAINNILDNPWK